jgi:transcriptional regulator with XRE-family HTH domain
MGPSSERVAANIRRIRRACEVTTAALSQRLAAIGHPIADTGITKTEKGDRRIDVDDLVALALALGVTPNTLLLPQMDYLGTSDTHLLTPNVGGTAERLWQWAQGERPVRIPVPGSDSWLGDGKYPSLEFSARTRPYLTALHAPAPEGTPETRGADSGLRDLALVVTTALAKGATGTEVRRVVELAIALPTVMSRAEIAERLKGGKNADKEEQ